MLVSMLLQIPMLVFSFAGVPASSIDCLLEKSDSKKDQVAVADFTLAVSQYVELHRQLEGPMSPRALSSDAEQIQRATDSLAAAIRHARPISRPGSVFTPQVADFFRHRITTALRDVECDVASLLDEMEEAGLPSTPRPAVNASLQWGIGYATWPSVLWRLPLLPEELEYRFVGRDIVLLDVHANLVVDILEGAVPAAIQESDEDGGPDPRVPHGQPCDAHPALAVCWM